MADSDLLALLDLAADGLMARAGAVTDWTSPVPCEGWDARALVAHLIGGNRMAQRLIEGADRDEARALLDGVDPGDDPAAALAESLAAQRDAFTSTGEETRVLAHPMGDFGVDQVLAFRIGDLTLHTWDLARGTGGDETLDPTLVAHVWEGFVPLTPFIGQIGVFGDGPSGDVDADAPLQQRLLDLTGRRP